MTIRHINYRLKISGADFDLKMVHLRNHLISGEHVETIVMLRGRETFHPELAFRMIERINLALDDAGYLLSPPLQGKDRHVSAIFAPNTGTANQPALVRV